MTTSKENINVKNILFYLAITLTLLTINACGGGGGGSDQIPPPAKTTATLKINLTGSLPTNTVIAGVDFTLTLPINVTPALSNGAVANGVVSYSETFFGSTLSPQIIYTAAVPPAAGTLKVILSNSEVTGVTQVGEVATITLQLADGVAPTTGSFGLSAVSVIDAVLYDSTISGMGASVASVTLQ